MLAHAAQGLPAGALNLLLGGDDVALLLARSRLAGLHVIGAAETARRLCREALEVGTRVYAEVAGIAAVVVLADADLDEAAQAVAGSAFGLAGQRSGAVKRVVVEAAALDRFVDRLAVHARQLAVGDPSDDATRMGPLRDAASARRTHEIVEALTSAGTPCHAGGTPLPDLGEAFFAPTVLGRPLPGGQALPPEAGPVVDVVPADDPSSLTRLSSGALAVGILTSDVERAQRLAEGLDSPSVVIGSLPATGVHETLFGQRSLVPAQAVSCALTRTEEIRT